MKLNIFCILLLFLCSCTKDDENINKNHYVENELQCIKINTRTEPTSLDPRKVRDIPGYTIVRALFEGLTRIDSSGKPILAVAKNVTISDDLKTYTFNLRKTKWSNGCPVTSADFEYAWKTLIHPEFPADLASYLYVIKNARDIKSGKMSNNHLGVTAKDSYTLVVELEHPVPYFLELTAIPAFFPVNTNVDLIFPLWADDAELMFVSNGPFSLNVWKHNDTIECIKNEFYWDKDNVNLDKITFSMVEDEHTEFNMFENNELDWAGSPLSSLPPDAIENLKTANKLKSLPMAEVYCYKFNTKKPPFDNVNMRKAFTLAMNRQQIIDNITQSGQIPANGIIPPSMLPKKNVYFKDADSKNARLLFEKALAEMNITKEQLPEITLSYCKSEKHQKISQVLQQQWNQVFDIQVHLLATEWNILLDKLNKHDFQIAGRGWVADFLDPINFLNLYKYTNEHPLGGNNDTQWENKDFVLALDAAESCLDSEQRNKFILDAEQILMNEMPLAPLYHASICYVINERLKNVVISPTCVLDFKWAYIRKDI